MAGWENLLDVDLGQKFAFTQLKMAWKSSKKNVLVKVFSLHNDDLMPVASHWTVL